MTTANPARLPLEAAYARAIVFGGCGPGHVPLDFPVDRMAGTRAIMGQARRLPAMLPCGPELPALLEAWATLHDGVVSLSYDAQRSAIVVGWGRSCALAYFETFNAACGDGPPPAPAAIRRRAMLPGHAERAARLGRAWADRLEAAYPLEEV